MSDNVTSNFPTMGDEGIPHSVVNLSARPSPYTHPQPRDAGRASNPNVPGTGDKANRGATLIHNAQGPAPCHFATLYAPNAACATEGQRNVRLAPPAMGTNRNFWAKRAEGSRI